MSHKKMISKLFASALGLETVSSPLNQEQQEILSATYPKSLIEFFNKGGSDEEIVQTFASSEEFATLRDEAFTLLQTELNSTKEALSKEQDALKSANAQIEMQKSSIEELANAAVPMKEVQVTGVSNNKINLKHKHNMLAVEGSMSATDAQIDVSELNAELSQVIRFDTKRRVLKAMTADFTSAKFFRTVPATRIYEAALAVPGSVLQSYKNGWNPSKTFKFEAHKIENRRLKIDFTLDPSNIVTSWLSFLYNESKTPEQMPITLYIVDMIKAAALEDIEMRMAYKGEYRTYPEVKDGDAATPAEHSVDGIETILLREAYAATTRYNIKKTDFDMATATPQQYMDYVELFYNTLPKKTRSFFKTVYCSPEFLRGYLQAQDVLYNRGAGVNVQNPGIAYIQNTDIKLTSAQGMTGSPILYSPIANNQIMLININKAANIINDIQAEKRNINIMGEMWLAFGFEIPEGVTAIIPNSYKIYPDSDFFPPADGAETQSGSNLNE